jgi:hypothetical protein
MRRTSIVAGALAGALGVAACSDSTPPEVGHPTEGSSGSGTAGGTTAIATGSSTGPAPADDTSSGPGGSSSDSSSSSGSGPLDSTGTSEGTTVEVEGSGSSSEGTTGGVSPVGCADGFREALLDEAVHPNVAACAGGFWVPGVGSPVSQCDRQGGDDGPLPDGMGCSIEDLCAEGWHLCTSRQEVAAAGLAGGCDGEAWGGQFFATSQSGEGANTCNDTGTNDVFGCGDVGYPKISGCAPLNRSTGNLCVSLPGAWACNDDAYDEVTYLVKPGPDDGGALCCRD